MHVFLLSKIEDVNLILSRIKNNNFSFVHHHEGIDWMLKFILVKYLSEPVAMIERVSAYAHHSQKGKSIVHCNRQVEYLVECFGQLYMKGLARNHLKACSYVFADVMKGFSSKK